VPRNRSLEHNSMFILQITQGETTSVPVYTMKAEPTPISKKIKPTITIFI